jgi:hypothetical protein
MFEHAREHVDHYRTLVGGRGGAVALAKVREMVTDLRRDELGSMRNRNSAEAIPREVIVQYVVGAFMAVLDRIARGSTEINLRIVIMTLSSSSSRQSGGACVRRTFNVTEVYRVPARRQAPTYRCDQDHVLVRVFIAGGHDPHT